MNHEPSDFESAASSSAAPRRDADLICDDACSAPPVSNLRRRAQALVEIALVVPSAILIFLGTVDLGRAFYEAEAVHQAVMTGALEAMNFTHVTDCAGVGSCSPSAPPCYGDVGYICANDAVICAMTNAVPWAHGGPDCRTPNANDTIIGPTSWTETDWAPGATFTITMNHTFHFITPFLSSTKTLTLSSTVSSRRHIQ